jgi:Na+/H+ antiporter NhaC
MEFGYLSLLPVVLVFVMAFVTRKVLVALLAGTIAGVALLSFKEETMAVGIKCLTDVFSNGWSLKSILFCFLIGAFVYVIDASGGVEGLVNFLTEKKRLVTSGFAAQLLTYGIGLLLFIDGVSSIVVAGVSGRPLFDKLNVSRHKLAYIIDSTSSPVAWLFPINAAGAFLMVMVGGQISSNVIKGDSFGYILSAVPFQLYGILSILVVGFGIFSGKEIGDMKTYSFFGNGKENQPVVFKTDLPFGVRPKSKNMLLPLLLLVGLNFVILCISGNGNLFRGDGATSLVLSGSITILLTGIFYWIQRISNFGKYIKWCLHGMSGFLNIVVILVLAFALSNVIKSLETGIYIANLCREVDVALLPLIVFLVGAIISFATGTSGGTVAILIPITIPLAAGLDANISLILGAIISSAVFGDHCSPISDSTILSSMIAEIPVMEHVKTQMPYALLCGLLSAIGFLTLGYMM